MLKNLPKKHLSEEEIRKIINSIILSKTYKDSKRIKSLKLLMDKEKSERKGKIISRGVCFVDFDKHESAKIFLENVKNDF